MELLKNFALLLAAIAIPVILVMVIAALADTLPVLGLIIAVAVIAAALCFLTLFVKVVRGK